MSDIVSVVLSSQPLDLWLSAFCVRKVDVEVGEGLQPIWMDHVSSQPSHPSRLCSTIAQNRTDL